jgi:arsenate reductase (glutaredoxin)
MKVYQKPTCSKCRDLLKTLRERKVTFDAINYYTHPLGANEQKGILKKLGMEPIQLMRSKEGVYKELAVGIKPYSDAQLINFMVKYPDLIQRPIVIQGNKASIARTDEAVQKLLD